MRFSQHDTLIASTMLSITAGTILVMISMSTSTQGWTQRQLPYVPPDSSKRIEEQISQSDRSGGDTTEDGAGLLLAPWPPQKASNTTDDQTRLTDRVEQSPRPVGSTSGSAGGSGGGGGGSGGGRDTDRPLEDHRPKSKPDPRQDHDDRTSSEKIPFSELHGVNFIDSVLRRQEGSGGRSVQTDFIDEFVAAAKESNFNVFRIPVRWESYVDNKDNFLEELDYLVKVANKNGIFVWIEFHHFDATSNWPSEVSKGGGFPKFVVSCYKPTKGYERDPEVRAFWDDYYSNKVKDSRNKCRGTLDVWTLQAGFMKDMINKVDDYPNVIGYELLNEPHIWKDSHYDDLGEMNTALAKKLRKATDKVLLFTRETAHGLEPDGSKYQRKIGLEHKILPKDPAKNVMYVPHLYDLKEIERHVADWKDVQRKWASMGFDVEIGVGEWATQPPQLRSPSVTQSNIDGFVSVWEREKWMHTYWAFGGFGFGEGDVLVKLDGDLARAGEYYEKSIEKHYDD